MEETLSNLQVSYIDLVMPHGPGPFFAGDFSKNMTTKEEFDQLPRTPSEIQEGRMTVWQALQDLQKAGKIKNLGVCNFTKRHLEALMGDKRLIAMDLQNSNVQPRTSLFRCLVKPVINQIELHPYLFDRDIVQFCQSKNIVVQAFSPIGRGFTGGGQRGVKIGTWGQKYC